jgi:5-formyltetrahydrofolate cyclo-ligase
VSAPPTDELRRRKEEVRSRARAARHALAGKDAISRRACERLVSLPAYAAARTVLFYVDVRGEVRTRPYLPAALTGKPGVVVPWCDEAGGLELFRLTGMDELVAGKFGIPEPRSDLRRLPGRRVAAADLDLVVVPGVAFDRRGGRLGHGFGYYDRLLRQARADTPLVALAFECQLVEEVPTEAHDVFMDLVVTEAAVYQGLGRRAAGQPPVRGGAAGAGRRT